MSLLSRTQKQTVRKLPISSTPEVVAQLRIKEGDQGRSTDELGHHQCRAQVQHLTKKAAVDGALCAGEELVWFESTEYARPSPSMNRMLFTQMDLRLR